jgi:hypothetical protein
LYGIVRQRVAREPASEPIKLQRSRAPHMTERIFHRSGPVTVELVLHRPERLRASGDGPIETRIHVFDAKMKAHAE